MTAQKHQGCDGSDPIGPGRVPDALIDAVLDGDIDAARSKILYEHLAKTPDAAREVAATERAIEALKAPIHTPDMSYLVLSQLGGRHGFTTAAGRRQLWITRIAAAAVLVLTVGGAFAVQRFVPQAAHLVHHPTPVSDVVAAVPEPATQIAGIRTQITCGLDDFSGLTNFARVCMAPKSVEVVAVASEESSPITIIVMQRTAPAMNGQVKFATDDSAAFDQFAALHNSKSEFLMASYAQSPRPDESLAMWGATSGSAHVEPMMLLTPAAAFDWVGLGDGFASTRGNRSDSSSLYR